MVSTVLCPRRESDRGLLCFEAIRDTCIADYFNFELYNGND